jgi:hypothetical protein
MNIGVRIDPYHMQVRELLQGGKRRRTRHRVVSTQEQGLVQVLANSVQLLAAFLRIKLVQCNHVRLGIADSFEYFIIDSMTTLIHSRSLLPLVAHANYWLEF